MLNFLGTLAKRLMNELPTIAAGVAAVLYVVSGTEVDEGFLNGLVGNLEAVLGFVVWLQVRRNINGPVTNHDLATLPPQD